MDVITNAVSVKINLLCIYNLYQPAFSFFLCKNPPNFSLKACGGCPPCLYQALGALFLSLTLTMGHHFSTETDEALFLPLTGMTGHFAGGFNPLSSASGGYIRPQAAE